MVEKKQIGKDGYSESFDCEIHDGRWRSSQSATSCAATLTEDLFLLSINDLSNKTRCPVLANFTFRNSFFPSNSLSGLISLNPIKTVSAFVSTSGKLEEANHKVSV